MRDMIIDAVFYMILYVVMLAVCGAAIMGNL